MRLSESVPRLLQLVTDAEDDQHALASACAWIADQPGVSAVTFVSAGDGRVLCGSALDSLELTDDEVHQTINPSDSEPIVLVVARTTADGPAHNVVVDLEDV